MKSTKLVLCAFFAALSAILSQVALPIGPEPIAMTHISIFLAAGLLGAKYGVISQTVYVLIGAFGVPVFPWFVGGLSILVGPRGGFIIGYLICSLVTGLLYDTFGASYRAQIPAMCVGFLVTYVPGVAWFMFQTGNSLTNTLLVSILPFLPFDIIKTLASASLIKRLRPVVRRRMVHS